MRKIEISAAQFFDLLKQRDTSMWAIFSSMMDVAPAEVVFVDEEKNILFSYFLPETKEQLEEDRKLFAKEFSAKLAGIKNKNEN